MIKDHALVLAVALLVIGLAVGIVVGYVIGDDVARYSAVPIVEAAEPSHDPRCYHDVWIIAPGDTAWAVAAACYPGEHTGERASEIVRLNGVDAGALRVGMVLQLPEGGGGSAH